MDINSFRSSNRVICIDGLRGIAAMGVVCFHLSANLTSALQGLLPDWLITIFRHGYLGVPVFFVISGFVIELSVGNNWGNRRYFLNFMLRRFIRLSPVYWASILFSFVLLSVQNRFLQTHVPFPSGWGLVAHIFYLQDLFSIKPIISVVYWTLCIEVQLYVFYAFTCWFSQWLGLLTGISTSWVHTVIIGLVGFYSLGLDQGILLNPMVNLFFGYWHYFLMGILLSQAFRNAGRYYYFFFVWMFIEITGQVFLNFKLHTLAGLTTCLLVYCNGRFRYMEWFLGSKWVQYLGAISYSLYIVHPEIGWKVVSFGKFLLNNNITPEMGGILFIAGIVASIFTAHIFHIYIEKPSLVLNSKLRF